MMLWKYLREHMLTHPTQKVCENGAEMTFENLVVFAETFAKELRGQVCCAIYCRSEMAAAMALLGCFAAGITALPLSTRYGDAHVKRILEHISPSCLICDIDGKFGMYSISDSEYVPPEEEPALIMCTSGTTGVPKGVMLSEKNIVTNVRDICEYFDIGKRDSALIARPLYHCAVLTGEFLTSLVKGTGIVFHSGVFSPATIAEIINTYEITVFGATPTLMNMLCRAIKKDTRSRLKHLVISGECMSASTGLKIRKAFPDAQIYHVYGLTEAGPRVSFLPPEHFTASPDSVGIPLSSVRVKILNDIGNEVKDGEIGILWVKGDNVTEGYYNSPELTAQLLKDGWLCTGDIALIDENGWLKIKGRSDDMIIRAGMNIYPSEIEAELKKDKRVKDALVYGYSVNDTESRIALKISGSFKDENEVKKLCIASLPSYQVPSKIELVDELDKNESGKTVRQHSNNKCN